MKKAKSSKTTVTVRLTPEEYALVKRVCSLKKTTCTGYLTSLATRQARQELLCYAADAYLKGEASVSTLAKKTGLDVPTILDEVARLTGKDTRAVDGFLSAVKTLAAANNDPEFYEIAVKALK